MDIKQAKKNNLNRRRAFRIFEQVDLFYHPIEIDQETEGKFEFNEMITQSLISNNTQSSEFISVDQRLPTSHSKENETLNVNVSSTGISFTCEDKLIAGDYLMIRVLLLSSMTVIMTCCKVVYCRPSNPFENNQYPYLVGTHFVNLKQEDKDLLNQHINKKRTRHFITNSLLASLVVMILIMPDLVFEFIVGVASFLFDESIEVAHILYELFEYSLDHVVEHIFHTAMQETQIIVFYIQIALGISLIYPLVKGIIKACKSMYFRCGGFCFRKKSSMLYYWGEQSLLHKMGFISTALFVITCYVLFFI